MCGVSTRRRGCASARASRVVSKQEDPTLKSSWYSLSLHYTSHLLLKWDPSYLEKSIHCMQSAEQRRMKSSQFPDLRDNYENEVCGICLDAFSDPVTLPCGIASARSASTGGDQSTNLTSWQRSVPYAGNDYLLHAKSSVN